MYYTVERSFVNDRFAKVLKSGAVTWCKTHGAATKFATDSQAQAVVDRVNVGNLLSARTMRYGFAD